MKKPMLFLLSFVLLFATLGLGQITGAFSDIQADPNAAKIAALKEAGIIKGEANGNFNPKGKLTYAAGITSIVNGLEISLAHFTFNKAPQASDYFTHAGDNAWYSDAFIVAHLNGIDIPQDVKPGQTMTREEFAHYLFQAIQLTGDYAYTLQFIEIEDQTDITPAYSDSIQKLLISGIITLDQDGSFHPQAAITRSEALGWLYKAIQFVKSMKEKQEEAPIEEPIEESSPLFDLKLESKPVNEEINEVTVSAQAPHPGYGIRITSITFEGDQAIIYTQPILPDEDKMYPQVITEVKASTYIASSYTPVLAD